MQLTKFFVAAAAVVVVSAQTVQFTNSNFNGIQAGVPFNITWTGASSDITLKLKSGPANAQTFVSTIATSISGNSYSWVPPPSTIVTGTYYNLEIDHDSDLPNYSPQFTIAGGLASSVAVSSTASVTSALSTVSGTTSTGASSASSSPNTTGSSSSASASASKTSAAATTTSSHPSGTSSSSSVPTSNNAAQHASPFAFVLMSFVAIAALN